MTLNHSLDTNQQSISQNQVLTTARLQIKSALIAGEYQNYEQAIKELSEALVTCGYSFEQSPQMLETLAGIHTLLGINYNLNHQPSLAIQAFESALKHTTPHSSPQLKTWQGRALENLLQTCHALSLKEENSSKAMQYLKKASDHYVIHPCESREIHELGLNIQQLLIEQAIKQNNTNQAIDLLKQGIQIAFPTPLSPPLLQVMVNNHLKLGELYFQQKNYTEALIIFEAGLKMLSKNPGLKKHSLLEIQFECLLGQCQYQLKQYSQAPFWFKLALEDYQKISSPSNELVQLQIKICEYWVNSLCHQAIEHHEQLQFQESIKLLLKGLKICQLSHPSDHRILQTQQLIQSNLILNYLKLGSQKLEQKSYLTAIKVLSKVNQLSISYQLDSQTQSYLKSSQEKLAQAYHGQGLIEYYQHHFKKSILCFKKALDISTDQSLSRDCLLYMARSFLQCSCEDKALKCLKRIYPEPTCTLLFALEYSLLFLEKNQPQKALSILFKAAQHPLANMEWLSKIRLAIANIYMSQKCFQRALDYLTPIIKAPPKLTLSTFTQVQYLMGQCYLEIKSYQRAKDILMAGYQLIKSSQSPEKHSFIFLLQSVHSQQIEQLYRQQNDQKILELIQTQPELTDVLSLAKGISSALRLSHQCTEKQDKELYFELIEHWLSKIKQASLTS